MKKHLQYGAFALAASLLLTGIQTATAQNVEQDGAKLYATLCAGCHTPTPAKMMGKPVDKLVAGMEKVKKLESPTGPLVQSLNSGATGFNAPVFDEQQGYAVRVAGLPLHGSDWRIHVGANASAASPERIQISWPRSRRASA